MQIIVESRDADATPMRELSIARVRFALRRLKALVPRAKVQFSDVNGPRGGIDKRCQVELKTDSAGTVVIASLARDWRTALDRSIARATRVLRSSLRTWPSAASSSRQPCSTLRGMNTHEATAVMPDCWPQRVRSA